MAYQRQNYGILKSTYLKNKISTFAIVCNNIDPFSFYLKKRSITAWTLFVCGSRRNDSLLMLPPRRHSPWCPRWASIWVRVASSIGRATRSGLVQSTKWARPPRQAGRCAVSLVAAPTTILQTRPHWDLLARR